MIDYTNPDAILLQETKLNKEILSSEFMPSGYNIFRKDRVNQDGGGGVLVAVRSCYPAVDVEIKADCELVWVTVSMKNKRKIHLGSFYRPPSAGPEPLDQLDSALRNLHSTTKNPNSTVILGGDFNCGHINWDTNTITEGCASRSTHEKLLDVISDHHLTQMQREPTRLDNILDLYCTNKPGLVKYYTTIPGLSDHEAIIVDSDLKPEYTKKTPRKVYSYSKADWTSIKQEMNDFTTGYLESLPSLSVEDGWSMFKTKLQSTIDKYIPSRMTSSRQHLPWITPTIRRMVKKKQRLYNRAKKSGRTKHWDMFHCLKRDTRKALRNAHNKYLTNIFTTSFEENNTNIFWRYVKAQRQDSTGVGPLKRDGQLHSRSKEKAEILSDQFKSVFTHDDGSVIPQLEGHAYPSIGHLHVSAAGISKLLLSLKVRKASGPDNIPARVLKELADPLSLPLSAFFNHSLEYGVVPSDWKSAFIAPIFKKGNKQLPENYRPVSLTCICSKLLEHVICRHILDHLELHNILSTLQHGFRSGRSCETQLLTTLQDFLVNWDRKTQVDVAILDFAKVFDTVPHDKLLYKLQHYGIRSNIHTWISSFLKGRTQTVVVDGSCSTSAPVISGVPQGTVLGPLLFLLHINDLPLNVRSQVRLFADDCLLYRPINSAEDQEILQHDLRSLEQWGTKWGMRFNASKCEIMRMHRGRSALTRMYSLGGLILRQVDQAKYLGITITEDLTWAPHINNIAGKANAKIGFLWRNLRFCPRELREQAYFTLVRSIIEYSASVWDPHYKKDITTLDKVQRRAARFVVGDSSWRSSVTAMLQDLGWKSLEDRRRDIRLALFFKAVHGLAAVPTTDTLIKADKRTRSNHPHKFRHIPADSTAYRQSFFTRTVPQWNSLPPEAVTLPESLLQAVSDQSTRSDYPPARD